MLSKSFSIDLFRSKFCPLGKKNMGHYEEALPMLEQALSESWRIFQVEPCKGVGEGSEYPGNWRALKDSFFEW